jgi:hypothetical protein
MIDTDDLGSQSTTKISNMGLTNSKVGTTGNNTKK